MSSDLDSSPLATPIWGLDKTLDGRDTDVYQVFIQSRGFNAFLGVGGGKVGESSSQMCILK